MNRLIKIRIRKKSILVVGIAIIVTLLSIYGILYILTPYSGFARSLIWGDSDIKDYERFPFRTIENEPPVFQFFTVQITYHDVGRNLSSILHDDFAPNSEGGAKMGR